MIFKLKMGFTGVLSSLAIGLVLSFALYDQQDLQEERVRGYFKGK